MAMGFSHFIFALLAGLDLILAVHAQDQSGIYISSSSIHHLYLTIYHFCFDNYSFLSAVPGFISIACGAPENSISTVSGIKYISDATFVDTGIRASISREFRENQARYLRTLRSFPQGNRSCYTINVTRGTKYLIRAYFLYGNYDGIDDLPQFDLYLGPNRWDTIDVWNSSVRFMKELIHVPSLNYIHVCLVNTNYGTPFISAIDLRPLKNTTYVTKSGSLALFDRADVVGSQSDKLQGYDANDPYFYG